MELSEIIVGRNQTLDEVMKMADNLKKLPPNYDPYPDAKKSSGGDVIAREDHDGVVDLAPIQREVYTGKVNIPRGDIEIIDDEEINDKVGKIVSFKYKGTTFNLYNSSKVAIGTGY